MGHIWLGDLAVAFAALRPPDDESRAAIAALLGLATPSPPGVAGPAAAEGRADSAFLDLVAALASTPLAALAPPEAVAGQPESDAPRRTGPASGTVAEPGMAPRRARAAEPEPEPAAERASGPGSAAARAWLTRRRRVAAPARAPRPAARTDPQPPVLAPVAATPVVPLWTEGARLERADYANGGPVLPHEPLLAARSAGRVLYLMLARACAEGPVDVDSVVAALAALRPVRELPRTPLRTLRFGVQVLVDRGDSTRLWGRDQVDVVRRVRRLVGRERAEVLYFTGSPLRGVASRPAGRRCGYRPPPRGARVLIVTDFGLVPRLGCRLGALPEEWLGFLRLLARRDAEPVGLVPYPSNRWPPWLAGRLPLVVWDRRTTANAVRTRLG